MAFTVTVDVAGTFGADDREGDPPPQAVSIPAPANVIASCSTIRTLIFRHHYFFEYISAVTPEKGEAAWLEKAVLAAIDGDVFSLTESPRQEPSHKAGKIRTAKGALIRLEAKSSR